MTTPAQFFTLPDGRQSSIQVKVVADATGDVTTAPLEISTPQQFSEWQQILAAAPLGGLSQTAYDAHKNAAGAIAKAELGADKRLIEGLEAQSAAQAGIVTTEEPKNAAERERRIIAAKQRAAALGLELVYVPVTDAFGHPPHMELRQSGMAYAAGKLTDIETRLEIDARNRARRDETVRLMETRTARPRIFVLTDEQAAAMSPQAQIDALKAQVAELAARG